MKHAILLILLVTFMVGNTYSIFGLITKDDFQLVKAQIESMKIEVSELVKVNANFRAEVNTKLVGYDRSINREEHIGGDKIITNSEEIFKMFSATLLIICLVLIFVIGRVMKRLLKIVDEKKVYKQKYYDIKNGGSGG